MTHEPVRWTRGRNTQDGAEVWLVSLDLRDLEAAKRACLRRMGREA